MSDRVGLRLREYTPLGVRGRIASWSALSADLVYSDTSSLTVTASETVGRALPGRMIVALEWSLTGQWDEAARFVLDDKSSDQTDKSRTVKFTGMTAVAWFLDQMRVRGGGDDQRRRWDNATVGTMMSDLVSEGQTRGVGPGLSLGFTTTHDSNGAVWPEAFSRSFQEPMSVLQALGKLVQTGRCEWVAAGMRLDLFVPGTGADRSGGGGLPVVKLGRAASSIPTRESWANVKTTFAVKLDDGKMIDVPNPDAPTDWGALEGAVDMSGVTEDDAPTSLDDYLTAAAAPKREVTVSTDGNVGGPLPFIDYWPGDWTLLRDGGWVKRRVVSATVDATPDGALSVAAASGSRFDDVVASAIVAQGEARSGAIDLGSGVPPTSTPPSETRIPAVPGGLGVIPSSSFAATGEPTASLAVSWDAVSVDGNGTPLTIDLYRVWVREVANPGTDQSFDLPGTTATLKGYTPTVQYELAVQCRSSAGSWSALSVWVPVTPDLPADTLAAPTTPAGVSSALGVVAVPWDGLLAGLLPPHNFRSVRAQVAPDVSGAPGPWAYAGLEARGAGSINVGSFAAGTLLWVRLVPTSTQGDAGAASAAVKVAVQGAKLTDLDAMVGESISQAETGAVAIAAADATGKADAAKQAAINAAAITAQSKADAAQAAATSAAATTAQSKADAAQAAALAAAKTYAEAQASGAGSDALAAAEADATAKANAAKAAAITAAATDATSKAAAAQSAATSAAATDATTKANAAAALANAAQSTANTAKTNAATAQTKANDAYANAATAQTAADDASALAATKASPEYIASRGTDLVTNGTGMLKDNTNFSAAVYDPADTPTGAVGSFTVMGKNVVFISDELMPVDTSRRYLLRIKARQQVVGEVTNAYTGLAPHDAAGLLISPQCYMWQTGTDTTLAVALKPGDTTVKLTSAANWNNAAGARSYLRTLIFWDWTDSLGKTWPIHTYSRYTFPSMYADGGINFSTNTITLETPWTGPALPAGASLSNGSSGGSYMYGGAVNAVVPQTWTEYSAIYSGVMPDTRTNATTSFPPGCVQVSIIFLVNRATSTSRQAFAGISFSDATAALQDAAAAQTTANTAIANAATAQAKAVDAYNNAATAQGTANTALSTANGKNKVIFSTSVASGTTGYTTGDIWFQTSGSVIVGQWTFTTSWQARTIDNAVIANLDVGKLTAGTAQFQAAVVQKFLANQAMIGAITTSMIAAGVGGELDITGNAVTISAQQSIEAAQAAADTANDAATDAGDTASTARDTASTAQAAADAAGAAADDASGAADNAQTTADSAAAGANTANEGVDQIGLALKIEPDQVTLTKPGSDKFMRLTNERLSMMDGQAEGAWVESQQFNAPEGVFPTGLIGNHSFGPAPDGGTVFRGA